MNAFVCGVDALDRYYREQVSQDVRKRATACYVVREIARYRDVPVARLGRLEAVAFYEHHGFIMLDYEARQLVLPLAKLRHSRTTK